MASIKQPPHVHPKAPVTGHGQVVKIPPSQGIGPTKGNPVTGKQ